MAKWIPIKPLTGTLDNRSAPDGIAFGGWRERLNFSVADEGKLSRAPGWSKLLSRSFEVTPDNTKADGLNATVGLCKEVKIKAGDRIEIDDEIAVVGDSTIKTRYGGTVVGVNIRPGSTITKDTVLFHLDNYNNADLHDQIELDTDGVKVISGNKVLAKVEPINLIRELVSTTGMRKLLVATQTKIYLLNESTGNYKIIGTNLGGVYLPSSGIRRWRVAQLLDTVVLTNNYDPLKIWVWGQDSIINHADAKNLGIGKVAVVHAWRGLLFLANLEMDGERAEHRIIWSDYNTASSLNPGSSAGSMAGQQDLNYGERILAAREVGDYLLFFTNRAIWQVTAVGGAEVVNFRQVYNEPVSGDRCLVYPYTLTSLGDAVMYMGRDGIYLFNLSMPKPERLEWLHRSTKIIFDSLDDSLCDVPVADYHPMTKQVYFSWPSKYESLSLSARTLVANMQYLTACVMDHGFTAFGNFRSDNRKSFRDWLISWNICADTTDKYPREGASRPVDGEKLASGGSVDCFYTTELVTLSEGVTGENANALVPSDTSLCKLMTTMGINSLQDLCSSECNEKTMFIGASSFDKCLKQIGENNEDGPIYYRESLRSTSKVANQSTYATYHAALGYSDEQYGSQFNVLQFGNGYISRLLSGPIDMQNPSYEKLLRAVELEFTPTQVFTNKVEFRLRLGISAQALDPTDPTSNIKWSVIGEKNNDNRRWLEPITSQDGVRPTVTCQWPCFLRGNYLYIDLNIVDGQSIGSMEPPINGACDLTRISLLL